MFHAMLCCLKAMFALLCRFSVFSTQTTMIFLLSRDDACTILT